MSCCGDESKVTSVTPPAPKKDAPFGRSNAVASQRLGPAETLSASKEACDYIRTLTKKEGKEGWGLKIDVVPGGCAGYKYFMAFQEKPEPGEKTFEFHGIKLFLNLMSIGLLKGSSIDYVSSLEASGLKINNPNMTRGCGCGKSFS